MTPATSVATSDSPSSLVERLADELAAAWAAGLRPLAENLLARHPELASRPDAVLDLLAEELALRADHGEPTDDAAVLRRFPDLVEPVRALLDCQRWLGPRPGPPAFPDVGETLGEFRLLAELGRGAVGRVFLAVQPALADRPVVLKVTPDRGDEHLSLARLQHTHIVPLYSVHEFPDRRLRGLCMPYFGGDTLAHVADAMPRGDPTGRGLLAGLRRCRPELPVPLPVDGPAVRFLESARLVDAVCWLGACLADGLQYAHDRGLVHLDIKPSNVLIAADGLPMLLDFHLARPPIVAGGEPPLWVGGTRGYSAPEQLAALDAVRASEPIRRTVDGRADVYALGVLMAGLLRPPDGRPPNLPPGVAEILDKCAADDPADRFATAADLAGDLRRHLADLPLRSVRNPSLLELWRKWRRRRPLALPLMLATLALTVGGVGWIRSVAAQVGRAEAAFRAGEAFLIERRYEEAAESFRTGEALTDDVPFLRELAARLAAGRRQAERGKAAVALNRLVDRVRPMYAAERLTPGQVRHALAACEPVWDRRDDLKPADGSPTTDLLDLGILTAHLIGRSAGSDGGAAAHRNALAVLADAERSFGASGPLELERAVHLRALGDDSQARAAAARAAAMAPRAAWEFLATGRVALAAGDLDRAAASLDRALDLDPRSAWANYHRGVCSLRGGRPAEAVAAFAACVALSPEGGWCWYNRGLAFAELDRDDRAIADFDQALRREPGLAAARLARARACGRSGRFADGFADVTAAAELGVPPAEVGFERANLFLAAADRPAAEAALRAALLADPDYAPARQLLTSVERLD